MAKLYTAIFLFLIFATMRNLAISAPQQPPLPPLSKFTSFLIRNKIKNYFHYQIFISYKIVAQIQAASPSALMTTATKIAKTRTKFVPVWASSFLAHSVSAKKASSFAMAQLVTASSERTVLNNKN